MKRIRWILFGLLCALLFPLLACGNAEAALPLRVHVMDVGQGSCVLLRTQAGDVLIDSGSDASQVSLCMRLASLGVTHLSLLILTGTGIEHIGGADGILEQIPTDLIWVTERNEENEPAMRFWKTCDRLQIPVKVVRAGERFSLDALTLSVLSPMNREQKEMVVRAQCQNASMLLMGDPSAAEKKALLSQYGAHTIACDVCLLPTHGAYDAATDAFLQALSPGYAVISCGKGNANGYPHGLLLQALKKEQVSVLRTDLSGEIVFLCDGESIHPQ